MGLYVPKLLPPILLVRPILIFSDAVILATFKFCLVISPVVVSDPVTVKLSLGIKTLPF